VNKDGLKEVFGELEFRAIGKRILGDDFNVAESETNKKATAGVQQDLFGMPWNCP